MSGHNPGIVLDGVHLRLGEREVLTDVSLRLSKPRTAVIGANGSGKSSFARLLNGLLLATEGTVRVAGVDPAKDQRAVRTHAGFVFSDADAQILMPTPAEDIALSVRDRPKKEAREIALRVLAEHGLADHADAPASSLSGGQKQLLALASVLATEPRLLIADEPTTLLDLRHSRRIGDLLLATLDIPLVLVTHDLELAARCDEAVLFDGGSVIAQGTPSVVIECYRESMR